MYNKSKIKIKFLFKKLTFNLKDLQEETVTGLTHWSSF